MAERDGKGRCRGYAHDAGRDGTLFVPAKYALRTEGRNLKLFSAGAGQSPNRARKYLQNGGVPVLEGDWESILLWKARIGSEAGARGGRQQRGRGGKRAEPLVDRLMVLARGDEVLSEPAQRVPFLLSFTGEAPDDSGALRFVVPLSDLQRIQASLARPHPVRALGEELFCHYQVLAPRSQETTDLVRRALGPAVAELPREITGLDMGCGSGVLTFLMAGELEGRLKRLWATDCLQEALGSTRYNLSRLAKRHPRWPELIRVSRGGDLFDPLPPAERLDLVVFNAPWVDAHAASRARLATNDAGLETIQRFLDQCRSLLTPRGSVLLCYADQSGARAVARLEQAFERFGYHIALRLRDRIRTSGPNKRWESVFVYILKA